MSAAATNATVAAIGGGAISAGGGGIALGTTILGATTLGVGLLVGGVIFNFTGSKLSEKADEAWSQMRKAEETINRTCDYLDELDKTATKYIKALKVVRKKYLESFNQIAYAVNKLNKTDWSLFTAEEKLATENTVLLVGLLYKMCQVSLVTKAASKDNLNTINKHAVDKAISNSKQVMKNVA